MKHVINVVAAFILVTAVPAFLIGIYGLIDRKSTDATIMAGASLFAILIALTCLIVSAAADKYLNDGITAQPRVMPRSAPRGDLCDITGRKVS